MTKWWLGSLVLVLATSSPAQQLRWQTPSSGPSLIEYDWVGSFADYDHDGYRDYLRLADLPGLPPVIQIASGADSSTLWQPNIPYGVSGAGGGHAGDMDGDGEPDLVLVFPFWVPSTTQVTVYSPRKNRILWGVQQPWNTGFGDSLIGDIDTDGDHRPDLVVGAYGSASGAVFVYDHKGTLRYSIPCLTSFGRFPVSLAKMGDLDGDGCDDFLIGCLEPSTRGMQWLVSGKTGFTIRESYGLSPGDRLALHVRNLGDIDGDDVNDYAAFPWWSGLAAIAVAYSGATGAVIRSWVDAPNSVVAGLDFDQDGINDLVTGADWILGGNLYGRTLCWSGRDGSELWRVDPVPYAPGTGSNGTGGWMLYSAALDGGPTSPYPAVAWINTQEFLAGTPSGLIRAFDGARKGQGPVTGTACTSSGTLPLIGVRKLGTGLANTGFRTTIAKTHPNALAALLFAFTPLATPVDLTPFGFAGCTLYVDPAVSYLQLTGTTGIDRGYAAVDLPHPLSAAATGTDVHAQWLVLDPATGGYAATRRHAIRLP